MGEVLNGDAGLVFLFLYLLPGFLGATAYYYLVAGERGGNFERVIHALVLTLVSGLVVHAVIGIPFVPNIIVKKDTPITDILNAMLTTSVLYNSIVAIVIGIIFAILNNHGAIYALARTLQITYRSSNADVWQDTFYKYKGYWICVRFSDGRSLIGWPRYFSPVGKPKELFIADATWWRLKDDGTPTFTDVVGPGVYIPDLSDVEAIELLE